MSVCIRTWEIRVAVDCGRDCRHRNKGDGGRNVHTQMVGERNKRSRNENDGESNGMPLLTENLDRRRKKSMDNIREHSVANTTTTTTDDCRVFLVSRWLFETIFRS